LCGFDINLTYPQTGGYFPQIVLNTTTGIPINSSIPGPEPGSLNPALVQKGGANRVNKLNVRKLLEVAKRSEAGSGLNKRLSARALRERDAWVRGWVAEKRDLTGRANGTYDPYYGCYLGSMLNDYTLNFSMPWSECASERVRPNSG
jgi:carboxypeptidase D